MKKIECNYNNIVTNYIYQRIIISEMDIEVIVNSKISLYM